MIQNITSAAKLTREHMGNKAYVLNKLSREGLPLNAFEIKIDNQTAFLKSYNKYNLMFTYMQLDKYMLALCHQERITNPAITLVHESDFYDYFRTWI